MKRSGGKVLVIDRDARSSSFLCDQLSGQFEILNAQGPEQALQRIAGTDHIGAVVLADVERHADGGKALLNEISSRWPQIRLIVLSGDPASPAPDDRRGVFLVLPKPPGNARLKQAIAEALHEYLFLTDASAENKALAIEVQVEDEARRAFLATMSHELLTPLNHVLGFSSMLEMKMEENKEEALEYLGHIKSSGETLLKLLKRVLEIVRLTSGESAREQANIDVAAILAEEVAAAQPEADRCGVTLSYQRPPVPIHACINEHELRFALQELINNAIKFNSPGGLVSIAARRENSRLMIRVSDTGKGMTREVASAALGLFTPENSVDRGGRVPIGLGVTFAVFFARAYGGNFAIESEKDVGTAIILTLPCGELGQTSMPIAQSA
jgi:signal transduction histidine kinase